MSTTKPTSRRSRRGTLLWVIAFFCVLAAASYQRRTGPSYPLGGSLELPDGSQARYELIRTQNSDQDAVVTLPASSAISQVSLHYRRHGVREAFTVVAMEHNESDWTAALPKQPAAGKLDYFLVVAVAGSDQRAPANPGEFVVIRFKNPVPALVLVPHILMMFISMLCGLRCGLAAIFEPGRGRRMTWVTLFCLSIGGLFLGPVVQKYAFGAYWTGWPVGEDLTDTKTLVMWAGWAIAAFAVERYTPIRPRARAAMLIATVLMLAVYLVPHSVRGSALDYDALDEGISAEDAIRTG